MISLPAAVRVYLYTLPCDMRKSFDSLSALAREVVGVDPLSGHLFVYASKRADRVKILYWDRDGWALWAKRLEAGTYAFPFAATGRKEIAAWELQALLEGIDLGKSRRRKRFAVSPSQHP
ncbi:MAG: IS66 family insertion sequence element accessory protein TnpB [Bryobacterales bacterium]|nr:IS66 family insertion sequence element accessory protein TnpB [Bryobacterales bacterium]